MKGYGCPRNPAAIAAVAAAAQKQRGAAPAEQLAPCQVISDALPLSVCCWRAGSGRSGPRVHLLPIPDSCIYDLSGGQVPPSQQEAWRDEAGAKALLRDMLPAINQHRASLGLPALVEIEVPANAHMLDMAFGASMGELNACFACPLPALASIVELCTKYVL